MVNAFIMSLPRKGHLGATVHVGSIPTPPQKKPNKEMQKKIDFAINLIRKAAEIAEANGSELEVCYSGGKDSDVILHLAQRAGVKYDAIYKNTTIDPPGTIAHALKKGVRMVRPQKTFAQLIRQKGMPSRFRRHCCSFLKEYKIHGYAIVGVRRAESSKRAAMYQEPERCRKYSAKEKAKQLEKERIAKEKAKEKERIAREKAKLLEKERIAKAKAKEKEKIAREKAAKLAKEKAKKAEIKPD